MLILLAILSIVEMCSFSVSVLSKGQEGTERRVLDAANQLLVQSRFYLANISNPRNLKPKLAGQGTTSGKGHTMKLISFFFFVKLSKRC